MPSEFEALQARRNQLQDKLIVLQAWHQSLRIGKYVLWAGAVAELAFARSPLVALTIAGAAISAHIAERPTEDRVLMLDFDASAAEREIDKRIGLYPELDQ